MRRLSDAGFPIECDQDGRAARLRFSSAGHGYGCKLSSTLDLDKKKAVLLPCCGIIIFDELHNCR